VRLETLPGYAPDLNPWDEGGWNHLKNVEMRNLVARIWKSFTEEFHLAAHRLRQKPRLYTHSLLKQIETASYVKIFGATVSSNCRRKCYQLQRQPSVLAGTSYSYRGYLMPSERMAIRGIRPVRAPSPPPPAPTSLVNVIICRPSDRLELDRFRRRGHRLSRERSTERCEFHHEIAPNILA